MTLWGMEMELLCSDGAEDNVEDTELTSGEGTDHDATSWETLGAQVHVASLSGDVAETSHHGASASCACLVHLGEQGVCRVRDDGGGNSGNHTREE